MGRNSLVWFKLSMFNFKINEDFQIEKMEEIQLEKNDIQFVNELNLWRKQILRNYNWTCLKTNLIIQEFLFVFVWIF